MRVTVQYRAQLRRAAGRALETVELTEGANLGELFRTLGQLHAPDVRRLLLTPDDRPQAGLLVFVGEQPADAAALLHEGATITILTPMAGG